MTEPIDWMQPIRPRPTGAPLWGEADASPTRHLAGVRHEQLRRAAIIQTAAKGAKVTKGNASAVVDRLARVIPGLRYANHGLIFAALAPLEPALWQGADGLPGRTVGRTEIWTRDRRADLVAWVDAWMRDTGEGTATSALMAYGEKLLAELGYELAPKTLSNALSEGRKEASVSR